VEVTGQFLVHEVTCGQVTLGVRAPDVLLAAGERLGAEEWIL
jgi:hypothetical protein